MVSKRFAGLVLGLLYAFCAIKESYAYAGHEGSEMPGNGLMTKGENVVFIGKESLGKVPPPSAARKTKLGGRKMAVNEMWMKEVVEKKEGLKGKTSNISTGATHYARKHYDLDDEGKKDLNVVVSNRNRIPQKFNVGALTSSTADYHMPRHHPSRNNR